MTSPLYGLEPGAVWSQFEMLCGFPRRSGNEQALVDHIFERARAKGLAAVRDEAGNLVVRKPGEGDRTVVIQGHLDMVCEKNADCEHDFARDPIETVREDGWITARGTTLGADNGIGVAMTLAALFEDLPGLPPIEGLFTVDEETGLTGAMRLGDDAVEGKILINLDSEEEGALYIGCAGGQSTEIARTLAYEPTPNETLAFRLVVTGLRGGHSGLDIHLGLGNAVKILARLLVWQEYCPGFRIADLSGGNMHNAIPREAEATVVVNAGGVPTLKGLAADSGSAIRRELEAVEPDLRIGVEPTTVPDRVLEGPLADTLVSLLHVMPNGVLGMSREMPGLVETSTNLATVRIDDDGRAIVLTSQRSSSRTGLGEAVSLILAAAHLGGFESGFDARYPAWTPNPDSELLALCRRVHLELFGGEPEVRAIHAGLECGLIGEKFPGMDMISFGPDIRGAHSPDERVSISSVANTWSLLLAVLREIR